MIDRLKQFWRRVFYPWDVVSPRQRADWTLDFALDELQRCYDALRAGTESKTDVPLAPGDVRMAVPRAGCVADSVHATVLQLRVKIRKLERAMLKED